MSYSSDTTKALDQLPQLSIDMRHRLLMRAIELDWLDESGWPELADSLRAVYDAHLATLAAGERWSGR